MIRKILINGKYYEIDCKSAYEIAVENGYEGTVEDWLNSLKGKTPQKGIDYFTAEDVEKIVEAVNISTKARTGDVTLLASEWRGTSSPYSQTVTVEGVTENSQVDLTPSDAQVAIFHEKDLAFVTKNRGGVVTVSAIGQKPMNDYEMQVTITEVEKKGKDEEIIGVTVGTPISLSKIREKFSPLILQSPHLDGLDRPCYILNIGEEYKGEAKEVIHHSLVGNFSGGEGSAYSPYIFAEQPIKEFTIKIIGFEGSILTYEYNGEIRTYDCSKHSELTPPYALDQVHLVWRGDLYLCNPDGIEGGKDGKDGKTPYIKNGNWWIGDTDTGVKAEGKDGKDGINGIDGKDGENGKDGTNGVDGKDGADGKNGADGKTPYIQDGYWYIDGVNTNVKAQGVDGKDGADGKDGEQGIQGEKGEQGEQGVQGIQGEKGDKGDKGDAGADGKDGANGTNGKDGISATHSWNGTTLTITSASGTSSADLKGDKGDKGEQGAKGDKGDTYTLTEADKKEIATASAKFDPTAYRLPILYLTGSTEGMTKENAVTLGYECKDKDGVSYNGSCTLKWQGSSSLAWDKKNYTVKFDKAFEVVDGWTAQKKYCLKANWIDATHSRNVVSAKLWGLVRKNRSNLYSRLKALPNAGAIDGFPCIIMLNGEFHGLYAFNIPKDAWMFGMGDSATEAIVGADNQADDTAFKAETLLDADGWELEYAPDEDNAEWVKDSLNNLIRACINSNGSDLDTTIAQYLDWESAIDYYIFAVILQGGDMITKNTILATFDGVKWYFSAYDMDTTYGLEFNGSKLNRAVTTSHTTFKTIADTNRVFELIYRFKTNELKARYKALRADALSESRICNYFENYAWDISSPILMEEVKKWTSVRGSAVNGIDQICRWVRQRLEVTDKWLEALPAQETPVEPDAPMVNLVPTSTDTDGSIYNGVGYKDGVRLSSSGGISSTPQGNSVTVGFMPWQSCGVIRIKGATFPYNTGEHHYVNFYKEDKTFYYALEADAQQETTGAYSAVDITYDETTGVTTIDCSKFTAGTAIGDAVVNAKYFRLNAIGKGADLIVTVNQEIE